MRNLGLDILRFLAVLLVIVRHASLPENISTLVKFVYTGGWIGVDLFFVISGFLISSLFFKEFMTDGSVDSKRFLIRRGFKIYPSFWLLTLISVFFFRLTGQTRSLSQIASELFFVQNYLPGIWLYTWSLAVEEHFYFGIALFFGALNRFNISKWIKLIPIVCLVVCSGCFCLRYHLIINTREYNHCLYNYPTHLRIDSLCFGVLISYLVYFKHFSAKWGNLFSLLSIALGLLLLFPGFVSEVESERWILIWGVTLFYIGSGCLVLGALKLKTSNLRVLRFLGILGSGSYSIYIWHMPVKAWLVPWLVKTLGVSEPKLAVGIYIVSSFGVGWLMHTLIEKPSLWLRDRIYQGRNSPQHNDKLLLELSLKQLKPVSPSA